jgi:hypothetical protein
MSAEAGDTMPKNAKVTAANILVVLIGQPSPCNHPAHQQYHQNS